MSRVFGFVCGLVFGIVDVCMSILGMLMATVLVAVLLFGLLFPPPAATPNITNTSISGSANLIQKSVAAFALSSATWKIHNMGVVRIAEDSGDPDFKLIGIAGTWYRL